jgi:hypothetical protein
VKQDLNEYTGHESLTLSDVETPMMENFKHAYVMKHRFGMKVEVNDVTMNAYVKNKMYCNGSIW